MAILKEKPPSVKTKNLSVLHLPSQSPALYLTQNLWQDMLLTVSIQSDKTGAILQRSAVKTSR